MDMPDQLLNKKKSGLDSFFEPTFTRLIQDNISNRLGSDYLLPTVNTDCVGFTGGT